MADTTHVGLSVTGDAEIKRLSDRVETLTKSLGQQILKADKLEKASARLHTTYKSTEKTSTSLTSAANKLSPGLDRVGKSADNTSDEFGRLERELKQSNKNFVALGGIVEKQTQQLNGYKGKLAQVTNEKRKFNKESKKGIDTSRQLEGAFRGAAGGVGKLWLAYGALVPMIAGFGVATLTKEINRLGASFEYMTKYSASLSDNSVSLDEIRDSLLGIKGVAKTPTELADGYLELIKAGVSAESALLDIETAAKYATVGELELGTATQQLVTITKAFEKSSRNASGGMLTVADTADIVAYAAQKSTASFGDMQTAFTYMTSLASIANVTLQESAAALMIMHDAGLKGSLGATSLRTAITRLINPNEKARKSFAELGGNINAIFDDKGNIKNIQSMMIELKRLKDTVSDKKWSEFSFASFGLRGMNINVMVDELAKLDTNLKDIGESMGFVDKVFNDVSETAEITAANLKASFEKALIRAFDGERATEVLTNLDKLISSESFQGSVIDLADGMYSVAEAAVALAPALTLVTTPLGWFADVIQTSSFGYKAIAAEMRGDAVAIAELAAAYNNITLTESDRYSILESEIVRVKTAIYETNKAMSEAGTNSALIATATADLRSELVRLETSYSTLEDTVYDRSLEGVKTPLEFAMLGIAAAADKAVASVAAMPDYTADIARTEFTPTPSLNPYANFQQAKSPDSLDDQWAAFEKKEADQKKAKEKAAKTSAGLAKKQAKAAEKQIEKAIENVERRIKAGQKLDSEQANWVKNSNDREQE
ncbi:phage tail tape measure protein, partial [Candidatus Babeliales bacterium]|nr:phage tail tape measure protein [Candidatus Babeliales bacterium]